MVKPVSLLKPTSTADRVARILRERILVSDEGQFLGSEGDLAQEIGISLPTLRQAARMLEYEELLLIKPGKGGGYFSRRPTVETAIKSASQYLSAKDLISNQNFMDAADPVVNQIVINACQCKDERLLQELQQFVDHERSNSDNLLAPEESFKVSAEFMNLLGRMSANVLLELFARILWNEVSVSRTQGTFEGKQDIVRDNYRTRLRVAEAVLAQDRDKAIKAWQKRSRFLRSWPQKGFILMRNRQAV